MTAKLKNIFYCLATIGAIDIIVQAWTGGETKPIHIILGFFSHNLDFVLFDKRETMKEIIELVNDQAENVLREFTYFGKCNIGFCGEAP